MIVKYLSEAALVNKFVRLFGRVDIDEEGYGLTYAENEKEFS